MPPAARVACRIGRNAPLSGLFFEVSGQPDLDGPNGNNVTPAPEPGSIAGGGVFRVPTMDPGSGAGMTTEFRIVAMQDPFRQTPKAPVYAVVLYKPCVDA